MNELTSAQREVLRGLPRHFPAARIDRLWIFPAHLTKGRESGFIVLSLLPPQAASNEEVGELGQRAADGGVAVVPGGSGGDAEQADDGAVTGPGLDPALRALVTVRYEAEPGRGGTAQVVERTTEEGWAPPERIERVIAGVSRRAAVEPADPHVEEIAGTDERWADFAERAGIVA